MSSIGLVSKWVNSNLKTFWRDPAALFFTAVMPLIFLFIFVTIFGSEKVGPRGETINYSTYYVPSIVGLGVIMATFQNLAISLTTLREYGILKRVRGTPLPTWIFISGRIGQSIVIALLLVVLIVAIGNIVYGVEIPTQTLPAFLVTIVVGAASFCCLGVAVTAIMPTENAAPAIANAIVLPLLFISGVFFSIDEAPKWIGTLASIFPVDHFVDALKTSFNPYTEGAGFEWGKLAALAAWGVGGLIVAIYSFRWTPREG